ncbi:hypothetical protein DVH24_009715 [Malus domestica]|uniref:Transposase Tnp1/En/Spm-like domain-containing protein n=1 Tax=Malus domestica TaxID=3750 RepID=A0A498JSJ6_MALDO|nr:hypothetical protein DVH24_009715 [Malus domestica]
MLIDEGIETEPPAFNLMEHDHIHHFPIPNNVEGSVDERPRMTCRAQAPRGINRPHWAPNGTKEGTLDWTDEITLELEPKIRRVCEMKMNDRWKDYKANLKKAYYTPCMHSPSAERFHCQDGRVNQGQWKLLVQLWDTGDAQEQVNGSKPDYITFFTLIHIRKNGEPVDARSAAIIVNRNEIIIEQVCHNVYADVLGPERYNRVRGFGTVVVWSDVPGIRIKKRGICREVKAITTTYEVQIKTSNIEIERLKMKASEREERQRIEQANVVAQLRKEQTDSMVVHNRRMQLEVENMKRELRAAMMSAPMRAADAGIVEPKRVDVSQACVTRTEQGTSLEIQASGEVEDDDFVVLHNNGTTDEMVYRPCMVNVTGFSK